MQPQRQRRRNRLFPAKTVLATLTLALVLIALAAPLGAAAADDKEEGAQRTRRTEPASTPAVAQIADGSAAETAIVAETPPADGGGGGAPTVLILDEAIPPPPPECPPGFVPALPPLNPRLGCIANNLASGTGESPVVVVADLEASIQPDPPGCPPGFEPALPPLNPELGCVGTGLEFTTGSGEEEGLRRLEIVVVGSDTSIPPDPPGCPDGWVPALPPLNPALKCINNTAGTGTSSSGGSAQIVYLASGGGLEHPGHCAEGYSYKLVLRENADGSLTWLYTCVPDGTGPVGPDDITGGDGGRNGRMEVSGLKFEVDVID